jgi:hypothetical protein
MTNSSDAIGNRTPDFPVCSAVPQTAACSNEYLTESDFEEGPAIILRAICAVLSSRKKENHERVRLSRLQFEI